MANRKATTRKSAKVPASGNSRVNLLVNALEDFSIGVALRVHCRVGKRKEPPAITKVVDDARADLEEALRGFTAPVLRVIEGGGRG